MTIRSHELRTLVIFQRRAAGTNTYGEPNGAWTELVRARAALEPLEETQEVFQALQLGSVGTARMRCRYKATLLNVTQADRVVLAAFPTFPLDITAVIHVKNARKEIHFLVERRQG